MGMVAVVEWLAIGVAVAISAAILRKSFASNLIGIGLRTIRFFGGLSLAFAIFKFTPIGWVGLLPGLLLSLVMGSLVSQGLYFFLRRGARELERRESWRWAWHLPIWWDRLFLGAFVSVLWVGTALLACIGGTLMSLHPLGLSIVQQSLILRFLVEPDSDSTVTALSCNSPHGYPIAGYSEPDPTSNRIAIQMAASEQADFLRRLSNGVRQTKIQILQATGLDTVKNEIEIARQIVNLPVEDKVWLLQYYPPLLELMDHPTIIRILDNEDLMVRFQQFADGNIHEVLLIAVDRDINALLEDQDILRLIRHIELQELLHALQQSKQVEFR